MSIETSPMEAKSVDRLPESDGWQFEPKWDGFRCLAFKNGDTVDLRAKSGKSLSRYFPEMVEALRAAPVERFVLDGELVIPVGDTLSFAALQDRVHPAESRVRKLSGELPALLILFDCLASGAERFLDAPLGRRRAALEQVQGQFGAAQRTRLSPFTTDLAQAERWLADTHQALDGVMAKRVDGVYKAGTRAMLKIKRTRTADCVVGGFRYATGSAQVGSLLLGLLNEAGLLDHVGFTSAISNADRPALTAKLEKLVGGEGFSGDAPSGPSRWSNARSAEWQKLRPELVVEVGYDQVTGGRFRHGTSLLRWRPDKAPGQCTTEQLRAEVVPGALVRSVLK